MMEWLLNIQQQCRAVVGGFLHYGSIFSFLPLSNICLFLDMFVLFITLHLRAPPPPFTLILSFSVDFFLF